MFCEPVPVFDEHCEICHLHYTILPAPIEPYYRSNYIIAMYFQRHYVFRSLYEHLQMAHGRSRDGNL